MRGLFRSSTLLACLATTGGAQPPEPPVDTVLTASLVRAVLAPLATYLRAPRGPFGDAVVGAPGWGIWDVRAPAAGALAEAALRDTVLAASGGRLRAPGDTLWRQLHVAVRAQRLADGVALLDLEWGTRHCTPEQGPWGHGAVHRYSFRPAGTTWHLVNAEPYLLMSPSAPRPARTAPFECADV